MKVWFFLLFWLELAYLWVMCYSVYAENLCCFFLSWWNMIVAYAKAESGSLIWLKGVSSMSDNVKFKATRGAVGFQTPPPLISPSTWFPFCCDCFHCWSNLNQSVILFLSNHLILLSSFSGGAHIYMYSFGVFESNHVRKLNWKYWYRVEFLFSS